MKIFKSVVFTSAALVLTHARTLNLMISTNQPGLMTARRRPGSWPTTMSWPNLLTWRLLSSRSHAGNPHPPIGGYGAPWCRYGTPNLGGWAEWQYFHSVHGKLRFLTVLSLLRGSTVRIRARGAISNILGGNHENCRDAQDLSRRHQHRSRFVGTSDRYPYRMFTDLFGVC